MCLGRDLSEEAKREELTREGTIVFDWVTAVEAPLTDADREAVKAVARGLLAKLKADRLVLDWRKK